MENYDIASGLLLYAIFLIGIGIPVLIITAFLER
jgi:cytochrome c biogenesis protein CcdA